MSTAPWWVESSHRLASDATRCTPGSSLPMSSTQRLGGALAAPIMRVADLVDAQVTGPSVGDHRGPWGDVVGDERVQRAGGAIRDDAHPAPSETLGRLDFHSNGDQRLLALGPAAGQPGLLTADIGLVDLHLPGQQFSTGPDQHRTQPVQHRPRGLVRPDLKRALQAQRGDAVLGGRERPARVEPHRQRRTRSVEDRARGDRRAVRARGALPPAVRQPPTVDVPALIADEPVRPAQPRQVVPAVRVRAEPRQELAHRSRIVLPASECNHGPSLLRVSGEP